MNCPEITDLTFSASGIKALEEIRRIQGLGKGLTVLLGGSVMVKIFVGINGVGNPVGIVYKIGTTDWVLLAQAMASVSPIVSKQIQKIAFDEYQKEYSGKEHEFWGAVMNGCGY